MFWITLFGLFVDIISILWSFTFPHYLDWSSQRKYFSSVNFSKNIY
ncbi:MAG: hypothetical protein U0T78_06155 [Cloacibacterium normanense]